MNKSQLYDLIYNTADKLFKQYNPCNICKDKHGTIGCNNLAYEQSFYLCCYQCKYKSKKGCRVKCLACKLSLCNDSFGYCCNVLGVHILFKRKLLILRKIAIKHGFFVYHQSKKNTMKHIPQQVGKTIYA